MKLVPDTWAGSPHDFIVKTGKYAGTNDTSEACKDIKDLLTLGWEFGKLLPQGLRWCEEMDVWGDDDAHDIQIWYLSPERKSASSVTLD